MKKTILSATAICFLSISACTQGADKIEASYVSPSAFSGRSCSQLMTERNEIVHKVNSLTRAQDKSAQTDAVATGVALLLFWPAAFALAATDDNATALSAAKGNYDAITERMKQQGCKIPAEQVSAT